MTTAILSRLPLIGDYLSNLGFSPGQEDNDRQPKAELPVVSETQEGFAKDDRIRFVLQEQSRNQKLQHYLQSLVRSQMAESFTASIALKAWRDLTNITNKRLAVPDAGVGPDGEILYSWNKEGHHFELEVLPNGLGEFFYLNHQTNEMWEAEYQIGDEIPKKAQKQLELFFAV